ncbi:PH domain-containing protein [Pseudonocardia sp. T1-2H]|uniref:PH domain-containing protein n=1 Tax=Pseudonocardia sp. T1-2H TaxID=3128899 RepID=UPI003100D07D
MLAPREIDEYLLPTERRVIRVRQHWAVMAKHIVQTVLFVLAMVLIERYLDGNFGGGSASDDSLAIGERVVDNLTFYLALVAVARFTINTILWWIERIVITDKRVMLAQGIITHKVGMMPLGKVTDLTFQRSFGGRILGYGTLVVESAGQIQALNRIDFMPRPEEIYEALSELVFGEKGKTRATGMLARPRWRRG